jgi:PAS domain S-box-containing protein
MQDYNASGKKTTEKGEAVRPHKAKLEHLKAEKFDRKMVEEKLQKAKPDKEILLNALMEHVVYRDTDMRVLWANNVACESVGLTFEELTSRYCYEIWHGRNEPCVVCPAIKAMKTGQQQEMEVKTPDGRIWFIQAYPVRDVNGCITGSINTTLEITECKKAEFALRAERDRAQKYLDVAAVMMVAIDSEGRVGLINKKGCHILGFSEDEILGKNWFDNFLPERIRKEVKKIFNKVLAGDDGPEYHENPVVTKNGEEKLIAWHNTVLRDDKGNVIAVLSSGQDITKRTKVEEALKKAENEKMTILNTMSELVAYQDAEHRIVWANRAACESADLTAEKILGRYCYEIWHGSNKSCENCPVEKAWKTGRLEIGEIQSPDGRVWSIRANPVKNKAGNVIRIVEITLDVTERNKIEEALRESEEKYRALVENSPNLVMIYQEGTLKYVNKAMCERLGWTFQKMTSTSFNPVEKMIPRKYQSLVKENIAKRLRGETIFPYEVNIKTRDGSEIPVIIKAQRILYQGKPADEVIHIDITERKKAEQKLLDYQRQLKSLASELTLVEEHERRRIADELHDQISQSLVSSKIELDALRHSVSPRKSDQILKEVSDSLGKAIDDMRFLTFDLSFPILYELGFEAAVAAWLVDQIQEKHGIATEFEEDKQPKPLDDDVRVLVFRMVRELLFNVVKHAHAKKVKVSIRKLGNKMYVSVEDDGRGFDREKVAATAAKKGGFGLFSIRERLEQFGGHLEIESAPGCGTKAALIVPLKHEKKNRRG